MTNRLAVYKMAFLPMTIIYDDFGDTAGAPPDGWEFTTTFSGVRVRFPGAPMGLIRMNFREMSQRWAGKAKLQQFPQDNLLYWPGAL